MKQTGKRLTVKTKRKPTPGFTGHRHTPEARARIKAGHARRSEIVENFLRNQESAETAA